jgi:hypothetical protein
MPIGNDHDHDDTYDEPVEAYCVRDRMTVEMEDPTPVWTRRGTPGTRGTCPQCGSTVFRMGRTEAHDTLTRPDRGEVLGKSGPVAKTTGGTRYAAFINYSHTDAAFAERLANDLSKIGIPAWYDPHPGEGEVELWASGVHPGLQECSHMVLVLSGSALKTETVEDGWRFFLDHRKPVVIAQIEAVDPPDDLRRRPRYDFDEDYKEAFREVVQALMA